MTAATAYDPTLGIPFGAYARTRIVGAFADEMRASDWATRSARKRIKETMSVQESLTAALGRTPSVDELANALGVDRETAAAALSDAARTVTTIDETTESFLVADTISPEDSLLAGEQTAYVRAAVEALPERMRYVVQAIYFDDRTVTEVAEELGITHSAVSQQRSEAIRLMREGMATHYADEGDPAVIEAKTSQAAAQRLPGPPGAARRRQRRPPLTTRSRHRPAAHRDPSVLNRMPNGMRNPADRSRCRPRMGVATAHIMEEK